MLPAQRNKVDISVSVRCYLHVRGAQPHGTSLGSMLTCLLTLPALHPPRQSLTEEEQKLFRLYGKLPTRKDILGNKLKVSCAALAACFLHLIDTY